MSSPAPAEELGLTSIPAPTPAPAPTVATEKAHGEKELAENELDGAQDYRTRVEEAQLPDDVRQAALSEVGKLERTSDQSPESGDIRSWLDTILDLPWSTKTTDWIDIQGSREVEATLRRLIKPAVADLGEGDAEERVAADLEEDDTAELEAAVADLEKADTGELERETAEVEPTVADLDERDTGEVEPAVADLDQRDTGEVEPAVADLDQPDTGEVEPAVADLDQPDTGEVEPADADLEKADVAELEGETAEVEPATADLDERDTGEVGPAVADLEEGDTAEAHAAVADLEEGDTAEAEPAAADIEKPATAPDGLQHDDTVKMPAVPAVLGGDPHQGPQLPEQLVLGPEPVVGPEPVQTPAKKRRFAYLALAAAALVALLIGGFVFGATRDRGVTGQSVPTVTSTANATESMPTTEPSDESARTGGEESTIHLENLPAPARPFETVRIQGRYRGGAETFLHVQFLDGGTWQAFPVPTKTNQSGRFTAYVEFGQPGRYQLRVLDPDSGVTSKPFVLVIEG